MMVMLRGWLLIGGVMFCSCLQTSALVAQTKAKPAGQGRTNVRKPSTPAPVVTPEREAAALTFVRRHHPRLAELLIHLEEQDKRQYQRAVRDLFRTSERLAQLQERDPSRYSLELRVWKIRSRIQLYSAQLAMQDDPQIRQQLKNALLEQGELQREVLENERQRIAERLKKIDQQLHDLKSNNKDLQKIMDALIERKANGARVRRDRD
jgi:hypothetical protein